jgi:hypothetical protein
MTLPRERTSAVIRAREFLLRLCSPYGGGIKRIPREVRQEARRLLRHYPGWFDLGRADAFDAATASREGLESDAEWLRSISATKTEATPDECSVPTQWTQRPYYVDPPEGWRWGFPRLYDPATDGDMRAWMVANGYPQRLADQGLVCTFTAMTEDGGK